MGKSVVIVCPDKHLGGLSSGGLGFTDTGNKAVIGGLSREFYHRVWKHYQTAGRLEVAEAARSTATRAKARPPSTASSGRCGSSSRTSPSRCSRTSSRSSRSPSTATSGSTASKGVTKAGGRIASITMLSGKTYRGKMFIDATYEGDLMAAAGVDVPRRPRGEQRLRREVERRAGRRAASPASLRRAQEADQSLRRARRSDERRAAAHQHRAARRVRRRPTSKVQAYCFRMCLTDHAREPHPVPEARRLRPEAVRTAAARSSTPAGARRSTSSTRSRITRPTRTTTGRSAPTTSA